MSIYLFEIYFAQHLLKLSDQDFHMLITYWALTIPPHVERYKPYKYSKLVLNDQIEPVVNIDALCKVNENFRYVLQTGIYTQLVLMSLNPGENIGLETHTDVDQTFKIVKGSGKCIIDGTTYFISKGYSIFVKAGQQHDIINTSMTKKMKLITTYSPPEHPNDTIQHDKPV